MESWSLETFSQWLLDRGLAFMVAWGLLSWQIYTSDMMFGLQLDDKEKSFIIIILALLCLVFHHFVIFWRKRSIYYSPASFSTSVYNDVRDARNKTEKYKIAYLNSVEDWKTAIIDLKASEHNIPKEFGRESFKVLLEDYTSCAGDVVTFSSRLRHTLNISELLKNGSKNKNKLEASRKKFLDDTEWVMKDK